MSDKITLEFNESVLTLTLNRPEKLNCIDQDMLDLLESHIEEVEQNTKVRVLLIRGAGERAFSSGADLKAFQSLSSEEARQWIISGNRLFNKIERLPKPTIAVLRGYVLGGGLELVLACDFRIGAENVLLSSPELQHGWLPGWGGMTRLRRLIGEARAKEIVLLGNKLSAEEAYRAGLLTRVVKSEHLETEVERLIADLTKLDLQTFALAKAALMDEHRSTSGADLLFDVLALNLTNNKS